MTYTPLMDFTAIIKKGETHYVALCTEIDVVSQGKTPEEALKNLKEAVELYIEEIGIPKGYVYKEPLIKKFSVEEHVKAS